MSISKSLSSFQKRWNNTKITPRNRGRDVSFTLVSTPALRGAIQTRNPVKTRATYETHITNFICCLEKNNWFHTCFQVWKAVKKLILFFQEKSKVHQNNKGWGGGKKVKYLPLNLAANVHPPPLHFCQSSTLAIFHTKTHNFILCLKSFVLKYASISIRINTKIETVVHLILHLL